MEGRSGGLTNASREVECRVCGDKASGKHYGVPSCDGCRGFFKRSIRRNLDYVCKEAGNCIVDVTRRNQCQSCRFKKCLLVNMKRDAVQHERAPRASAISKSRLPFQTFNPATHQHGPSAGLYFAPVGSAASGGNTSAFNKHCASSLSFYNPYAAMAAAAAAAVASNHTGPVIPMPSRQQILFQPPPPSHDSTAGHQHRLPSRTTIIPINSPNPTSSPKITGMEKSTPEEEVSTTTDTLEIYSNPASYFSAQENVYEAAAKLLFLSIKWARSVPSFGSLPCIDQASLLESSWSELFLLSAAQWGLALDESFLVGRSNYQVANARRLAHVLERIGSLHPDHTELACCKAVVLFKPETASLTSRLRIELLQDQTMLMLQEYCYAKTPLNKVRFGKLLLTFPYLKTITSYDLEELFFKQTVGEVSIRKLIAELVKTTTEF